MPDAATGAERVTTTASDQSDAHAGEDLRRSVRGWLAAHWPAAGAIERAESRVEVAALWVGLCSLGLGALGAGADTGGLTESALVMEELGRAACPAPLVGAVTMNLVARAAGDARRSGELRDLLAALHAGSARFAIATAGLGDPHAGELASSGSQVHGTLRFVDAGLHATHALAWVDTIPEGAARGGLAIIELACGSAQVHGARALGLAPGAAWAEWRLHNAPALFVPLSASARKLLIAALRVLWLARAHGAARRAFELAVEHARERKQFGHPIGRFQAVQHKLADNLIALEGVRLTLAHAAAAFDREDRETPYFAATAHAYGGTALRQAALQTHHALGAVGYAEEHEAPRHFRRAHLDVLMLGGTAAAREDAAARLLDEGPGTAGLPEYDLGPAGNAFRTEVREWLAEHWSGERKAEFDRRPFKEREFDPGFTRALGETGWIGLTWPREHGGQQRAAREQIAFIEVMERAEVPRFGAAIQAQALLQHGTPEQRERYLPEIQRGEAMHGMGYSEPEAGSDLAALRTSARLSADGREWIINGQKIWTTTWWGRYMFLAARTDPQSFKHAPHKGISVFIVPMDTRGITVRPASTMYDGSFANIFYDDVRIPAENIVGPVNGGWKVLTDALAHERALVGGGIVLKVAHAFDRLAADLREDQAQRADARVRDRIGALAAEIEVGRRLMLHCAELAEAGQTPPVPAAISKVFSSELMERFGEAALDLIGPRAALSQGAPGALRHGRWEQNLRHSLMWVISVGTNEIQRSLIAQRGLELPR
jgi:alkylation response protein AidB-like acyl-CoA dehydrogenase